ncbi:cation:proton antiporter [bacterium]|nr:cation:proton antiporter [bacterium]
MNVPIFFALIGGIILVGFLANLLFKLTKIPSVLLLMAIGVFLGPVTGWIASDQLVNIAPYFGTMALLIILFEGGLELDIITVVRQAPKATVLALGVFIVSVVLVMLFGIYVMELSTLNSLLLAAVLGATSPAICIPVVQGLSVRDEIKTIVKLESALGDVLLIVSVLLLVNFDPNGNQGIGNVLLSFVTSFGVAFVVATIAGVLWSRLIAWMGKEPLAYMLTLGFMFLLYFMVEEMHGSAAIAVLMFGLVLENMQVMTDRIGKRMRNLFGIDIKSEKFILNQFIKNITEELSFLLRTFFFVYLGMLLDFNELTWTIGLFIIGITALLLISRWGLMQGFRRIGKDFTGGELQVIMAMLPRGLATAVMALLPFQQEQMVGTELFPLYAFGVIVLTNLYMTGSVIFAERRLRSERKMAGQPLGVGYAGELEPAMAPMQSETEATADAAARPVDMPRAGQRDTAGGSAPHGKPFEAAGVAPPGADEFTPFAREEQESPQQARTTDEEPAPQSFTDWMAKLFGIRRGDRERGYLEAYRAAHITEPLFWVQVMLAAAITTLGLILNQSAIIIGGSLIMPIMFVVLSGGLSLASGDIYLLLRITFKLLLTALLTALLAAILSDVLPFDEVTSEIAARTRPTVIDFLIALFGGMAGAATLSQKNRFIQFLPGAIISITLLPPLAVVGFGFANGYTPEIVNGGMLLFTANVFATILGAMLVFLLVGMPKAANFEAVRKWKEQELSHPVISLVFEKLRLSQIVGKTGSARARIIVIGVFLLVLLIPLQSALNQLTMELRVRRAITQVSNLFDVKYRSTIINTSSRIEEDLVEVKLQVATNSFFTSADIQRFEERVSDRTGVPTRLDLVQTLSDIGEGSTVRRLLTPSGTAQAPMGPRSFAEAIGDLRFQAQSILRSMPLSAHMDIVSLNAELTLDTLSPALNFVYLADQRLSEDAYDILATMIAGRVSIPRSGIQFNWIDRTHQLSLGNGSSIDAAGKLQLGNLGRLLAKYPQLALTLRIPRSGTGFDSTAFAQRLGQDVPELKDAARIHLVASLAAADSIHAALSVIGNLDGSASHAADSLAHKNHTR